MTFLEVQLDTSMSYGAEAGPTYQTLVVSTPSRQESRIQQVSRHYRSYKVMLSDKTLAQMQSLENMFIAAQGKTNGFRFKDNRDYKATNEALTNFAGGTYVQLIKSYGAAFGRVEIRPIYKPQTNLVPITITRDGISFASAGNWSVNTTSGMLTFTADQTGHIFTWTGQFDVPVRFDVDDMNYVWESFGRLNWNSVPLLEITL